MLTKPVSALIHPLVAAATTPVSVSTLFNTRLRFRDATPCSEFFRTPSTAPAGEAV